MTTSPAEPVPAAAEPPEETKTAQPPAAEPPAAEPPAAEPPAAEPPAAEPPKKRARRKAAAKPAAAEPEPKSTDIVAGPGGVMTDEVGVVTGDLTLRTEMADSEVIVRVQYKDADEWYAVTGAKAVLRDPSDIDAVHAVVVGILNRPEG
ncbi:hypothetical protein [Actinoplanes sp. URMC 104]|uniref:hypothetical protein n=1 Tax=Actinoplanes sp. URMC 104 TaxID=3423409 RepID=UPI003F1AB068